MISRVALALTYSQSTVRTICTVMYCTVLYCTALLFKELFVEMWKVLHQNTRVVLFVPFTLFLSVQTSSNSFSNIGNFPETAFVTDGSVGSVGGMSVYLRKDCLYVRTLGIGQVFELRVFSEVHPAPTPTVRIVPKTYRSFKAVRHRMQMGIVCNASR